MNEQGAFTLSQILHKNELYGTKGPYFENRILVVVNAVKKFIENNPSKINPAKADILIKVAYFHDCIEHGHITHEGLLAIHKSMDLYYALKAITRKPNEAYFDYLIRCRGEWYARIVKICDIRTNLANNPSCGLQLRYEKALDKLGYMEKLC